MDTYSAPDQPLVPGAPAQPIAAEPLRCPEACFTEESIPDTVAVEGTFAELGTPDNAEPYGSYEPSTTGELYRRDTASWSESGGHPDACFFMPTSAPYASSVLSTDARSPDPIFWTGTHLDAAGIDSVDQSVRLFQDSDSAEAYLADIAAQINECTSVQFESANSRYTATVDAASALGTPVSVASAGWIRTGEPGERWRAYSFDLQRGNLVVRTRLLTDGTIRETDFRRFVQFYAAQLAAIEPPAR
jgi:PknH-like extracellular domain